MAHGSDVWLPVRILEGLTTGLLAVLVLFRSAPVAAQWNARAIAAVIVSNGHGFAFTGGGDTPAGLELACRITMTLAAIWACAARLCLGRNFAILPALREVRTRGPYAIVRHPIYLSLIVFDVATVGVYPSAPTSVETSTRASEAKAAIALSFSAPLKPP